MPLRLHHGGVSSMKNMFNKKFEEHQNAQQDNPFSSQFERKKFLARRPSKDDEDYGKPLPGSKSEARAMAAQAHVMMEIKYLVEMIWDIAEWRSNDGRAAVTFGKLFNLYIAISDKVVGTLLRARKHGYVDFPGEMLYQRRDDDTVIQLSQTYNTIRKRWGLAPVDKGGEVMNFMNDEDITRRNSVGSKCSPVPRETRRNSVPPMPLNCEEEKRETTPPPSPPPPQPEPPVVTVSAEIIVTDCTAVNTDEDNDDDEDDEDEEIVPTEDKGVQTLRVRPAHRRSTSPTPSMGTISEDEEEK